MSTRHREINAISMIIIIVGHALRELGERMVARGAEIAAKRAAA
nr:hypothetical protein [Neorhizobium tomejilense]